jgi:hypothetical protein
MKLCPPHSPVVVCAVCGEKVESDPRMAMLLMSVSLLLGFALGRLLSLFH